MNINDLFQCPIFKDIPLENREFFVEKIKYRIKFYKKGEFVATQGDTVEGFYVLLKGSVKTEMISESGGNLNIETIKSPNLLAPAFLFAENNKFPVDVIALENCEIIIIDKSDILKKMAGNEVFLKSYIAFSSNKTNFLSERIKLLSIKTIKGKIAQYILGRTNNMQFIMNMNQRQLAEYFGVARPSLSRSLSEMIDSGIIELDKNNGIIIDMNALKELIVQ